MENASLTTPVEIDTKLAELYQSQAQARLVFERIRRSMEDKNRVSSYTETDRMETEVVLERLGRKIAALEETYTDWPRYYHVTNNNGHIHNGTNCSSCFPDTTYYWRTDLSGLTEQEVVDREAYNACSVCMPIAPAEQRAARERYNAEQRAQRATEKDAAKNAKLAKAAERAVKFLAKVDKQVANSFGTKADPKGWDTLFAEYSLYGHDGKKSLYDATFDMPSQVGNYLYDEMKQREAGRPLRDGERHMKDPAGIIIEAREKGLI